MENYLFGAAGLTKNDDIVKYKYFGYGKYSDKIINIPDSGYKYSKYAIEFFHILVVELLETV